MYRRAFQACIFVLFSCLLGCSGPQYQPQLEDRFDPVIEQSSFNMPDGYRLPFDQYQPSNGLDALVVSLHGFNDYGNAFKAFCEYLAERRIGCIAYDQRGFGRTKMKGLWPQDNRHQKDLAVVLKLLKDQYPAVPIYVAGESMGGAVILSTMAKNRSAWSKLVEGEILFAPAVWARSTQPWYQRLGLWLAVNTFPGWKPTGESLEIVATDNNQALREMSRDPYVIKETRIDAVYGLTNLMDEALESSDAIGPSSLILYGKKDEVIPKKPTCEMLYNVRRSNKTAGVVLYPDGYHMLTRDLQASKVFSDVVLWITQKKDLVKQSNFDAFCS